MTGKRVENLYAKRAKLYQFLFIDVLQWGKTLEGFFQENAALHSRMKILDAGCGTGVVTRALYRLARQEGLEGITFHAFDLTPAMLAIFRAWIEQTGAVGIHLQQADALELPEQLPPDWSGYDLIVSSAMLEYIPKDQLNLALRNLKDLLASSGRLLLLATKRTRLTEWTAAKLWRTNLFAADELKIELRRVGFEAVAQKTLPGSWGSYMLAFEASTG